MKKWYIAIVIALMYVNPVHSLDLKALQEELHKRGDPWIAGETYVSKLSLEEKRALCNLMPTSEQRVKKSEQALVRKGMPPTSWDWRDYDGHNWMTPIVYQRSCGSCWAIPWVGAIESRMKIFNNTPNQDPWLSTQFLISCNPYGYGCQGGRLDIGDWVKQDGIPDEACFPYEAQNVSCNNRCPDWALRAVKITDWGEIPSGSNNYKNEIMNGPVACGVTVKEDFFYYKGGVYEPIMGEKMVNHGVLACGWDSSDNWICKNSWGTDWGDNGYNKISVIEWVTWMNPDTNVPTCAISGNVSESLTHILGAYVHAFDSAGFHQGNAYTDSAGDYIIQNLVVGSYYVEVSATGYKHEFYDDVTDLTAATAVDVSANQTTPNINFILAKEDTSGGEFISGKVVSSSTDKPILCIVVAFSSESVPHAAITDDSGKYVIDGSLSATPRYLYAWAPGYIGEFYNDALTWEQATPVTPTADDIDFALADIEKSNRGWMSGTITSNTGDPVGDVMVYVIKEGTVVGCTRNWTDGRYIIDGLPPGTYTVRASRTFYGTADYSQLVKIDELAVSGIDIVISEVGIEVSDKEPKAKPYLAINSSNPSVGRVAISYHLPVTTHATLKIYNTNGQLVRTLVESRQEANSYEIRWNGRDNSGKRVPNGVYFCQLKTGEFKSVKEITLIR